MNTYNIHKIISLTEAEGPGKRTAIYFQGCKHKCKNCNSPQTWNTENGTTMTLEEIIELMPRIIEGVTISGGEPLDQPQELTKLCKRMQHLNKTVIIFTGYYMDEILKDPTKREVLKYTDILIDGKYQEEQPATLPLIGSNNQKFYFLSNKYTLQDIKKQKNKIEIHIEDGAITINGMGNNQQIRKIAKEIKNDTNNIPHIR